MAINHRTAERRQAKFYRNRKVDLFRWHGLQLRLKSGRLLATVEPDAKWPKMYRVRLPDGQLSDMINLSRAKDAAMSLAMDVLNGKAAQTAARASPMRHFSEAAGMIARPQTRIPGRAIESNEGRQSDD
jgi:hypothetical protein